MALIEEGAKAPMFTRADQSGEKHALKAALARGPAVVYFYPKDDTPGYPGGARRAQAAPHSQAASAASSEPR